MEEPVSVETSQQMQKLWEKVFSASNDDEMRDAYKQWAPFYEETLKKVKGYRAPELCAALLACHLRNTDAKILDIGAGTGLVGQDLRNLGYKNLDGLDICKDMLDIAERKGIYHALHVGNACHTDFADGEYDAIICVGSLNFGHIPASALREFVRIVRKGGLISFTMREDFYEKRAKAVLDDLANQGLWEMVELRETTQAVNDCRHYHVCCRVL